MTNKEKLTIYESRFYISDGVIHSLLVGKVFTKPVPVGFIESAYMSAISSDYKKNIKKLRKQLIDMDYYVEK